MSTKQRSDEPTPQPVEGPRYQIYMDLDDLMNRRDPRNAKLHDEPGIAASMERFGYIETVTLDERTGLLISGHGRIERLDVMRDTEKEPPEGVVVSEDGKWFVPTSRGWHSADDDEAEAALIAANQLVRAGGWDLRRLHGQLTAHATRPSGLTGLGFVDKDIERMRKQIESGSTPATGAPDETSQLQQHFAVLIDCTDETQQTDLLQELLQRGVTCRALVL